MRRAYDYWQDQPGCYFETGAHTSTQMLPCPRTSHSVSPPVGMPYRTHSARERAECFPSSDQITVISGLQKTRDQTRNTLPSDSTRSTSGSSCCLLASFLSTSYRGAAVVGRLLPWAPCRKNLRAPSASRGPSGRCAIVGLRCAVRAASLLSRGCRRRCLTPSVR